MIRGIDHVNLVVEDLDAMASFYRHVLGFQVVKDVRISGDWIDRVVGLAGVRGRVLYLQAPSGPRLELIRYESPGAPRPAGVGQSNTPGLRHLALEVQDIDALVDRLARLGVKFFSPVQRVPDEQVTYAGGVRKRLVYFHDPEGNLLELCEYR